MSHQCLCPTIELDTYERTQGRVEWWWGAVEVDLDLRDGLASPMYGLHHLGQIPSDADVWVAYYEWIR